MSASRALVLGTDLNSNISPHPQQAASGFRLFRPCLQLTVVKILLLARFIAFRLWFAPTDPTRYGREYFDEDSDLITDREVLKCSKSALTNDR